MSETYLWRLSGKTYRIFERAEEQPYRVKTRTIKRVHEEHLRNRQHIIDKARILGKENAKIRKREMEE